MYTLDYFINKFQAIPEDRWTINTQVNSDGQRCALGHCHNGTIHNQFQWKSKELDALQQLFRDNKIFHVDRDGREHHLPGVACVNNGNHPDYQQSTPKKRIIAALMDIKKAQPVEITNPPVYIEDLINGEEFRIPVGAGQEDFEDM